MTESIEIIKKIHPLHGEIWSLAPKAGREMGQGADLSPCSLIEYWQQQLKKQAPFSKGPNPLLRAVGGVGAASPGKILDATAGMGGDTLLFLRMGKSVETCESNPLLAQLWELSRPQLVSIAKLAHGDPHCESPLRFHRGPAQKCFPAREFAGLWPVIFLDPMYPIPPSRRSGLPKKNAQLLAMLSDNCLDDDSELFRWGLEMRPQRLVVKRRLKGAVIGGSRPHAQYKGKSTRYDVYFCSGAI